MVGVTSLSTMPSLCAERKMLLSRREMLLTVLASCRRISARAGDALSLISPVGVRVRSILRHRSGKTITSAVMAFISGNVLRPSSSFGLKNFTRSMMAPSERRRLNRSSASRKVPCRRRRFSCSVRSKNPSVGIGVLLSCNISIISLTNASSYSMSLRLVMNFI